MIQTHLGEEFLRFLIGFLPVDAQRPSHLMTKHDVFADAEIGAQVNFLIHGGDARVLRITGTGEGLRLAFHFNGTRVDPVHAGKRFDHRRFSSAVLAHESVDFTWIQTQVDAVQGLDARELDRDTFHHDDWLLIYHVFALRKLLSFCDICPRWNERCIALCGAPFLGYVKRRDAIRKVI